MPADLRPAIHVHHEVPGEAAMAHPLKFIPNGSSLKVRPQWGHSGVRDRPLFPLPARARPGSERLGRRDLQGDGGGRLQVEAGARPETQGAALQAGEVHGQEAKEHEEQHGHCPLADSRVGAQQAGVEDDHFTPQSRAHHQGKDSGAHWMPHVGTLL